MAALTLPGFSGLGCGLCWTDDGYCYSHIIETQERGASQDLDRAPGKIIQEQN